MEEIKVEDYTRINGIIGKVKQIGVSLFWLKDGSSYSLSDKTIKHSKNIIDLIEVGDIVNKSEVFEKGMQRDGEKWIYTYQGKLYFETELEKLTILTKEQYEKNCYTVERKE